MGKKMKLRENNLKTYIIYMAVIIVLFILAGYIILNLINSALINHMKADASRHASTHISRLTNSAYANKAINDLLEDRLISACNIVLEHEDDLGNEFLEKTGKNFKVDHIYWFDFNGKIIYSANDYLGWQASPEDSIYDFMMGDLKTLIEPIRKSADSEIYTKYGQIKGKTGFVQVGIVADSIKDLTNRFSPQFFMNELLEQNNILHAYYLNTDNEVLFYDTGVSPDNFTLDKEEKLAIKEDRIYYSEKTYKSKDVYEALYPIYIDDEKMGTLIIIYSLDDIHVLIRKVSYTVMILLILVFVVYVIMVINTAKKNHIIRKLAYYDPVTNIFNKNYFIKYMEDEFRTYTNNKKAILLVTCKDLGLLKINLGQEELNNLSRYKTMKLKGLDIIKENLFRYDEENLCVYVKDYENRDDLIEISNKILNCLDTVDGMVENEEIFHCNIVILELNENYKQINHVVKVIDVIIGKTDEMQDKRYTFFDERDKEEILLNEKIKQALFKAYYEEYEEFYLLYQPQLDLQTNKIVGVEALARWDSGELGNISPIKFISVAEKSRSINDLGKWVIINGCNFLKRLELEGINNIKVAINISVIQLMQESFVEDIINIISEQEVNPNLLKLEITETNLMDNYKVVNKKLKQLKEYGIKISLDDFGTGHSSLSRLKNLNIDYLKIDKSFVDHIVKLDGDTLINNILSLAKDLNLKVIAEGVEEEIQRRYLKERGCDIMQGYLFSKPIDGNSVISLIKNINKGEGWKYEGNED